MQSIKEKVHHLLENLPANADYDDIMEAIFVQQKIETGLNQLNNGEFISHQEMKNRLSKWLK
jgi:predicted transcriptional regulator